MEPPRPSSSERPRSAPLWARLATMAIVTVLATAMLTAIGVLVGLIVHGRAGAMAMLNLAPWIAAVGFGSLVVRRAIPETWRAWRARRARVRRTHPR